jgi:peptide/nickel transport system permease protein
MAAYLIKRLLQMIPTLLGVILLVFLLFNWVGGDPAYVLAGKFSNPQDIANIRRQLGVDQPLFIQFGIFLRQVLTFDYGLSWSTQEPVSHIFLTRLGPSIALLLPMLILETLIGVAIALAVAYVRDSWIDRSLTLTTTAAMSISLLIYIIVGQYFFAFVLGWFPVQGWANHGESWVRYAVLPILLGLAVSIAPAIRLYRTFVLEEMGQDYVRTARAKGLSEMRVMLVHVLRNASIPIITTVLGSLPGLLIGAFLLERFFSIPGIGREVIMAVERSDFPVIKAITVSVAMATMVFNLLADLAYQWVDPRVKLS